MKLRWIHAALCQPFLFATGALLLAACDSGEAPPPPPLEETFIAEQAAALEKAKAVEDEMQKAKEKLDRALDEQQ